MAVSDKDEYREEYRCLHTIKRLTKRLVSSADCNGPFKLFLDDLRFGNILVDAKTFEIKALIDWEFCYSALRQFLSAPPPWLKRFCSSKTGSRVGAHNTVNIDVILLELIQQTLCKSTLSIVAVNDQLSNPAHTFIINYPTAGESITSKLTINSNPNIDARGIIGKVLRSKSVFAQTHAALSGRY